MTKRAEMETAVGTADSIRNVDGLNDAFQRLAKTGQSTGALLRDMHKEWTKPTALSTSIVKLGAQVIGGQIRDAASAIAEPAKTSYSQALAKATEYRDATQRIATSTGQGYAGVGEQIDATARRLGILPGRVSDYSRSVRQLTGDWQGAMSGLDAYQNRALKTDRTLEELIPTAATLAQTFGLKSTDDVNRFFGTLDQQAKNAGASIELTEKAFLGASSAMATMFNAKPQQLTAVTAAFMGQAQQAGLPPELGQMAMQESMGLLGSHADVVERRMRAAGKLGKNERLRDSWGRVRGDKTLDALEFLQADIPRFYGAKNMDDTIDRVARTGMMSAQGVAGLMHLDIPALRKAAKTQVSSDQSATQSFLQSDAGKRGAAETQKELRDIGLGSAMLPAQDLAVSMGGGAAGVAIANAGAVFEKATGTFWNAVEIFAGKAGGGGAGAVGAGTAVATGGAGAGGGAAAGSGLLGAAAVPLALGVGSAIVGAGVYYAAGQNAEEEKRKETERESASSQGFTDAKSMRFHRQRFQLPVVAAASTMTGQADAAHPISLANPAGAGGSREMADANAQAMAKMFANQTLRVQIVTPPQGPAGQPLPP